MIMRWRRVVVPAVVMVVTMIVVVPTGLKLFKLRPK